MARFTSSFSVQLWCSAFHSGAIYMPIARPAGIPPNAILMKRLVSAARGGLLIAIVGAAVAFA